MHAYIHIPLGHQRQGLSSKRSQAHFFHKGPPRGIFVTKN